MEEGAPLSGQRKASEQESDTEEGEIEWNRPGLSCAVFWSLLVASEAHDSTSLARCFPPHEGEEWAGSLQIE